MYNNILFILIIFFLSLIYLKKCKSNTENFDSEEDGAITENGVSRQAANEIYLYKFDDNNLSIEENSKGELMKYYKFTSDTNSKIIIKLTPISENFYISFYIKFNKQIKNINGRQTFVKFISGENKTDWSLFKYNNHVYGSINKDFHKFYTLIDDNTLLPQPEPNKYHFVLITKKEGKLSFKLDEEVIEELDLPDTSGEQFIVFGGSKNNLLEGTTQFDGNISNIQYKYDLPKDTEGEMSQCNFYPTGPTKEECKTKCASFNTLTCDTFICEKICTSCKDTVNCPWNSGDTQPVDYIPAAPYPIRSTAGNKRVVLEWKKPFEGTNGTINSYIVSVKESYPSSNDTSNDEMIYNFEANDCDNCQYEIKDLKNTIYYDISVKSQNTFYEGTQVKTNISGTCSNIETIAPIGPINVKDYHPSLIESDEEIEMIYNNTLNENASCNQPQYNSGLKIDSLDMSQYNNAAIGNRVLGTDVNDDTNLNNTYLVNNTISNDITQYLGTRD